MRVEIDDKSGFCFGVVKAISTAEKMIQGGHKVYALGDIVHNQAEVKRLQSIGLETVQHAELPLIHNKTLLVRAHGEPPATYRYASQNNIKIVDATCPVVAKLQKIIAQAAIKMEAIDGQVVLLGKKGHAEVVGLVGQVETEVIVVENEADIQAIDFSRPIYFLSQTTQSLDLFNLFAKQISQRVKDSSQVTIHDTICRQVANRGPHLREFAQRFDVVIFVTGKKSSNGKYLFEICKNTNQRSYAIEDQTELDPQWFQNCSSVGVCGATSTPKWLMKQVELYIAKTF